MHWRLKIWTFQSKNCDKDNKMNTTFYVIPMIRIFECFDIKQRRNFFADSHDIECFLNEMFAYDWNISEPPFMNYKCLVSAHEQIFFIVWLSLVHLSTFDKKIDKNKISLIGDVKRIYLYLWNTFCTCLQNILTSE